MTEAGSEPSTTNRKPLKYVLSVAIAVLVAAVVWLLIARPWQSGVQKPAALVTSPTSSPTPVDQSAAVRRYASVMSGPISDIRAAWENYHDSGCDFDDAAACPILVNTLDVDAQIIQVTLIGAARRGVPAYIGPPPTEIAKLVADTIAAAHALDAAIPDAASSLEPAQGWATLVLDLVSVLDRWDPYL